MPQSTIRNMVVSLKASGAGAMKSALIDTKRAATAAQTQLAGVTAAIGGMGAAMQVATGAFVAFASAKVVGKTIREMSRLEEQTADLAKLVGEDIALPLRESILNLSDTMPIAREQLFDTAETAARLGIRGSENIQKFTTTMAKVGVATNESAGEAAESLARLAKITQTPISQIDRLASVVNKLSNTMATSFAEIDDAAKRAAAGLAPLGASAEEVTALTASLVEVSSSARRAGTRLRSLGLQLTDPAKVAAFAQAIGETPREFRAMIRNDPSGTILELAKVMRQGGQQARVLSDNITRIGRTVLNQLSINLEGAREALRRANQEMDAASSLQREYARRVDTMAARTQVVQNRINNFSAELGQNLKPILLDIIRLANRAAGALNKMATSPLGQVVPGREATAFRQAARQQFGGLQDVAIRAINNELTTALAGAVGGAAVGGPFGAVAGGIGGALASFAVPEAAGEVQRLTKDTRALANALQTRLQPAFVLASTAILKQAEDADTARQAIRQLFLAMQNGAAAAKPLVDALQGFNERGNTTAAQADRLKRKVTKLGRNIPTAQTEKWNQQAAELVENFDPAEDTLADLIEDLEFLKRSLRGNAEAAEDTRLSMAELLNTFTAIERLSLDQVAPTFRGFLFPEGAGRPAGRLGARAAGLQRVPGGVRQPRRGGGLPAGPVDPMQLAQRNFSRSAKAMQKVIDNFAEWNTQTDDTVQGIRAFTTALSSLSAQLGDTASKVLNFATQTLSAIARVISSSAMSFAGAGGIATLGAGILSGIAGFFQHGGRIPSQQFGIVGESGPELVRGPANVTPMDEVQNPGSVAVEINIPVGELPEADPRQAARDRQWIELMSETADAAEAAGIQFPS